MVVVALEVKDIPVEFILSNLLLFLSLHDFPINLFFVELVAIIIPSGGRIMMLPFAKADPAKLIRAHLASNMVAPLILLYRFLALGIWAHLSICNNPVQILGLRGVFDFPLLEHLTISWPVLFLAAPKAERVAADAVNNAVVVSVIHPLSGVVAHFAVRTPFHRLVIVCERLAVPSHVLFHS